LISGKIDYPHPNPPPSMGRAFDRIVEVVRQAVKPVPLYSRTQRKKGHFRAKGFV
jgi:hypothetical protein